MTPLPEERRGTRAVAVLLGLALVGGAVWALLPRMLGAAGGPEPELVSALRTAALTRAPILVPGAISGAVSVRPQAAGTAAGIMGFTQMALGAAITQYAGALMADSPSAVPMSILMDALAVALALSFAMLVRRIR